MAQIKRKNKQAFSISFQRISAILISIIAIPLFLAVLIFNLYTLQTNQQQIRNAQENILQIYQRQFEETLQIASEYVSDVSVNDTDYQMIAYAGTQTSAHISTSAVAAKSASLLRMHKLIGAICIYSDTFGCYRPVYEVSYPHEDLLLLKNAVIEAARGGKTSREWVTLTFSDRTVLLFSAVYRNTTITAMVDPAQQTQTITESSDRVFYIFPDGTPYASFTAFDSKHIPVPRTDNTTYYEDGDVRYSLIGLPLSRADGYIVYASPEKPLLQRLNTTQKILFFATCCLLLFIPICWLLMHRILLMPIHRLSWTLRRIQNEEALIRVPQDSAVKEVNEISRTVNIMLDTIRQQKIASYEQQLETQHAQLQYLQLQIRPHFFLNCLNLIYSMAEEGKTAELQNLIIDFSTYLRSIFKDSSELIPLAAEIRSVESYLHIQQAGTNFPPQLEVHVDGDATQVLIPPLSILTFVENAVKHSSRIESHLAICIRCTLLHSAEGTYLNVTVRDNGGGFSPEQLLELNRTEKRLYSGDHVGISNIQHRLHLLFGDRATLSFRNVSDGACVELFIPLEKGKTKEVLSHDSSIG